MKFVDSRRQYFIALGIFGSLLIAAPLPAQATDSIACDSTCESGSKMVSYADGNSITCACVAEGQMEPTVPDPAVQEGPVTVDAE